LIEIGSKTAEKNSAQTNRRTDRHYENNGHLAGREPKLFFLGFRDFVLSARDVTEGRSLQQWHPYDPFFLQCRFVRLRGPNWLL